MVYHLVYPPSTHYKICLHINCLWQLGHIKWCALSEVMFMYSAPLVVVYKLYPQFMYSLICVNRHKMVYRLVYPKLTVTSTE